MKKALKKAALCLFFTLVACLFSGCFLTVSGEYSSVREHEYQSHDDTADRMAVRSYYSLRARVQQMIAAHEENGTIIVSHYSGDLEEALRTISSEMTTVNAMGSYLVNSIVFEQSGLLAYRELSVSISYRRTKEEQDAVRSVGSEEELESTLRELFGEFRESGALYVTGLSVSQDELYAKIMSAWRQDPTTAIGLKELTFTAYPSLEAREFVLALDVSYLENAARLRSLSRQVASAARSICSGAHSLSEREKLDFVFDWINSNVEIDRDAMRVVTETADHHSKTDLYTAAGALIDLQAAETGAVQGAKALLDVLGVESRIVFGLKDETPHMWLAVGSGGAEMFFDPVSRDVVESAGEDGEVVYSHVYIYSGFEAARRFAE